MTEHGWERQQAGFAGICRQNQSMNECLDSSKANGGQKQAVGPTAKASGEPEHSMAIMN